MDTTVLYSLFGLIVVALVVLFIFLSKISATIHAAKQPEPQVKAPVVQAMPQPSVAPGIPPEVVAAIAGAIAAMGEGKLVMHSVRRVSNPSGAWGFAGRVERTLPF